MEKPNSILFRPLFLTSIISIITAWIGFVVVYYILPKLFFLVPFGIGSILILICLFSLKRHYTLWKTEIPLATISIANFLLTSIIISENLSSGYWLGLINELMIITSSIIIGRSIVHLNVDSQKRIRPHKKEIYPNMRRDNTNKNIMVVIISFCLFVLGIETMLFMVIK